MKTRTMIAVTLAVPLLFGACSREENVGVILSSAVYEQEMATLNLDQMLEMAPTAAGMAPAWFTLGYSERLREAIAERSLPNPEEVFIND